MEDKLQDYLKSLNPQPQDQAILVYGSRYHLWRKEEYLGIATWNKDDNVGDSFQRIVKSRYTGEEVVNVVIADKWELIPRML